MYRFLILFLLFTNQAFSQNSKLQIFFGLDVRALDNEQKIILDSLAQNMLQEKSKAVITGFADFLGKKDYNIQLSEDRANNIKNYLVSKGIEETKLSASGKGAMEKTEGADYKNGFAPHRKVEIFIEKERIAEKPIAKNEKPQKPASSDSNQEIFENLEEGENLVWENLNFQPGRHFLLPESLPSLEKLLKMLQDYPSLKIRIEGHICCERRMDDGYDYDTGEHKLSINRAKHIYHYLIEKGISAERLSYTGFGGKKPLVEFEITEQDRIQNRRVEIRVISK